MEDAGFATETSRKPPLSNIRRIRNIILINIIMIIYCFISMRFGPRLAMYKIYNMFIYQYLTKIKRYIEINKSRSVVFCYSNN